jgi:hypothetical protein
MKWIQHGSYSEVNPKESSSLLSRRHSRIMSDRGMDRKCWGAKVELYHGENTCFFTVRHHFYVVDLESAALWMVHPLFHGPKP